MNEVLIFRYDEFIIKITDVPDWVSLKDVLDAYAKYDYDCGCGMDIRHELTGIWLFPGSDLNFRNLGVQ